MKTLIFFIAGILFGLGCMAQQNNFVYIQADAGQTFYIKINGKLYSSSASGYAIIPKLLKGDYVFEVGFPKNEFPLEKIPVTVSGDAGYALKNFGSKGWGLFDMQAMTTLMAGDTKGGASQSQTDNGFINVLAEASDAPELKNTSVPRTAPATQQTPAIATTPAQTAIASKSPASPSVTPAVSTGKSVEVLALNGSQNSVTKLTTKLEKAGRSATYVSYAENRIDTIDVFIPYAASSRRGNQNNEEVTSTAPVTLEDKSEPVVAATQVTSSSTPSTDKRFLDIEMRNPNSPEPNTSSSTPTSTTVKTVVTNASATVPAASSGIPSFNSDCKTLADKDDFLKIRKKMAAEPDADGMLEQARKLFKQKCYSTEQIKNLSVLFLTNRGKYDFFDQAYRYVHDPQQFPTLQSELTEEYYINRFQALINH